MWLVSYLPVVTTPVFFPFHPIVITASSSQVFHKTIVSKAALDVVPVESCGDHVIAKKQEDGDTWDLRQLQGIHVQLPAHELIIIVCAILTLTCTLRTLTLLYIWAQTELSAAKSMWCVTIWSLTFWLSTHWVIAIWDWQAFESHAVSMTWSIHHGQIKGNTHHDNAHTLTRAVDCTKDYKQKFWDGKN